MHSKEVKVTPLGGFGEIGMNCLMLESRDSLFLIDCGLMFPEHFMLGVDVVIPDFTSILEKKEKLQGIILTHGHEDHIGALPWLLPHIGEDIPLYGSRFTLRLLEARLKERGMEHAANLQTVEPGEMIEFLDFTISFFAVCHSIVGGFGLGIESPAGKIVHTGDFKIDNYPLDGQGTDLPAFETFAQDGVRLMFSDSTNVEREGYALSEKEIKASLKGIFEKTSGRILVTLFSSHIQRMQEIFDLALHFDRKVAISGRSLMRNIELAMDLNHLNVSKDLFVPVEEIHRYQPENLVLLVTGSQGEPLASLSRIAAGEHKQLCIHEGDFVLMSSRIIPGNVRAITKVINNLYRLGAEVVYEKVSGIHASGHAHREELRIMLETVRPDCFIPVHGEYRHLVKHARLAQSCGVEKENTFILENGQPIVFSPFSAELADPVKLETVYVDGKGVGDVGDAVLKERNLLGGEGLVIVTLAVSEETGEILVGPDISSKGFVFERQYSHVLEDSKSIVLDILENISPTDTRLATERIKSSLRRFFRRVLDRDPVVIPQIILV